MKNVGYWLLFYGICFISGLIASAGLASERKSVFCTPAITTVYKPLYKSQPFMVNLGVGPLEMAASGITGIPYVNLYII